MEYSTIIEAIFSSGPITFSIFIFLVLLSILSWGVIFTKGIQFKKEKKNDKGFFERFNQTTEYDELFDAVSFDPKTGTRGLAIIYAETCLELGRIVKQVPGLSYSRSDMQIAKSNTEEIINRTLERIKNTEQNRIERYNAILATCSNVAPFIGLLGTVVGIINAFGEIGKAGSADLAFVAPAISEALVATAMGIFVAIPSSIAFNYFKNRCQVLKEGYDRFALLLLNRIQLYYFFKKEETG